MERVSVFIDGLNAKYTQERLGWIIDYAKLLQEFARDRVLVNGFFYTSQPNMDWEHNFVRFLSWNGYTVRTKPIKTYVDPISKATTVKCNLDVEMVADMFNTATLYDLAVLFSGDGDFERAVELLRSKGKRIFAVSTRGMVAYELVNAVDRFFDIADLRARVERTRPAEASTVEVAPADDLAEANHAANEHA